MVTICRTPSTIVEVVEMSTLLQSLHFVGSSEERLEGGIGMFPDTGSRDGHAIDA